MTINVPLDGLEVRFSPETSPPPELRPRRKVRRYTLPAPILTPAAAPGSPGDPTSCTCNPARWKWTSGSRLRHEPTCPRSKSPR